MSELSKSPQKVYDAVRNGEAIVKLSNASLGSDEFKQVAKALKNPETQVERICLDGNKLDDAGATALAESLIETNMMPESLRLSNNEIGDVGAAALAEALKTNTTLELLFLTYNDIGDVGATALAEALKTNMTLKKLYLGSNQIGDVGALAMVKALESNKTLKTLTLEKNKITSNGAKSIATALETQQHSLVLLDLDFNEISAALINRNKTAVACSQGGKSLADILMNAWPVDDSYNEETVCDRVRRWPEQCRDKNSHSYKRVRRWPGLFREKNSHSNPYMHPLYWLCRLKPSLKVVRLVYEAFPPALLKQDGDNQTPVHMACKHGATIDVIRFLLDKSPSSLSPLHWACGRKDVTHEIVELLCQYTPVGVRKRDDSGRFPLHIACEYGAALDVIKTLLVKYPDGAASEDDSGLLPWHYACKHGTQLDVVEFLVLNRIEKTRSTSVLFGFHKILELDVSAVVVDHVQSLFPVCHQERDSAGRLPLHIACQAGKVDVAKLLVSKFPNDLKVKDKRGLIPLHYAYTKAVDLTLVDVLLTAYFEGVYVWNQDGLTPLQYAKSEISPTTLQSLRRIHEAYCFNGKNVKQQVVTERSFGDIDIDPDDIDVLYEYMRDANFCRNEKTIQIEDDLVKSRILTGLSLSLKLLVSIIGNDVTLVGEYTSVRNAGHLIEMWKSEATELNSKVKRGIDYFKGNGVKKDLIMAVELFQEAANSGHTEAMYRLATCYDNGLGVRRSPERAADFFKKVADHGHPDAIFSVAICYDFGRGVKRDRRLASEYYRKSALEGNIFAIAFIYLYGVGVEQDFKKASEALLLAAEKQSPLAPSTLARIYLSGCGTPVSVKSATECLEQDIKRSSVDPESTFMLAEIFASSMEPADLRNANKLISSIEQWSSVYERAQWLRPFIDYQLDRSREDSMKWDVKPGPDFVMDADLQLIAFIGKGHFGKVFLAWHRSRESWVAVKFMSVGLIQNHKDAVRNILRERFTCRVIDANRANAPNVVHYEGFVDDLGPNMQRGLVFQLCADLSNVLEDAIHERDKKFVASRFADPESLPDWSADVPSSLRSAVVFANRGRWPMHTLLRMLRQVAEALEGVHRLGFLHCDIAPRNVLCDGDGNVKLADFGLARFVGRWGDECCQLNAYGKYLTDGHQYAFAWWAPECIGSEQCESVFSTNSDVFSFGTLMWQCFAHCDPYSDIQPKNNDRQEMKAVEFEILNRILMGVRPDLDRMDKDTPLELVALISNCWETDPENRPILRDVIEKLKEIEKKPHKIGPVRNRNPKMLKLKWFDVDRMYRALHLHQLRERAENSSGQGSYSCRLLCTPFDIFLAHSGAEKELAVDTMADSFSRSGFRCFFDKHMKNSDGAPTEQMRLAMEQCRHVVVVLSKSFLERNAPCQELVYAFERMEWLRQQTYCWESLWIVLFDLSVEDYKHAQKSSMHRLPDISSEIVLLEWKSGTGKFDGWVNLCNHLKTEIIDHDGQEGASSKWRSFLDDKTKLDATFPRAGNVYTKTK